MKELSKQDKAMSAKVLHCFNVSGTKSLQEITDEYNRRYPPTFLLRVAGIRKQPGVIKVALDRLVSEGLLKRAILSYTDRPLENPEAFYSLSQKGIQKLSEKGKRKV